MPEIRVLLEELVDAAGGIEVELGALSEEATARVLESVLGQPPDADFVLASHRVTGGNPFLVTEVARALGDDGVAPRADEVARMEALTPRSVSRSIGARLRRLSSAAQALARSAALFGMEAELRHAAELCGLDPKSAADAADELVTGRVIAGIDPLRFEHAIVRTAVLAEVPPARRAQDHLAAARLLARDRAPADQVANHLLLTPPAGDETTAAWLRQAGDLVLRRGAPLSAIVYFERALAEPPPAGERWGLLRRLGTAEAAAGRPAAVEHLEAALDECLDPEQRPHLALELGDMLARTGRAREAYALLAQTLDDQPAEQEISRYLETALITHCLHHNELVDLVRPRVESLRDVPGNTPGERALLAIVAYVKANDGSPYREALELARRAVGDGGGKVTPKHGLLEWKAFGLLSRALTTLGDLDRGQQIHSWMFAEAEAQGWVEMYTMGVIAQAAFAYTVGDLRAAAEDVGTALALAAEAGAFATLPLSTGMLSAVALERGEHEAAMKTLDKFGLLGPMPESGVFDVGLYFRGLLRGEHGDVEAGLADLFELGRRERVAGLHYPFTQWRVGASSLLARTGRENDARALLEEELAIARRRAAQRPLAAALRAAGLLERGDTGLALLGESVALLESSPFRLELARSEVELGATLRRANRRTEARAHLERGLELSFRCGATVLTSRASDELAAAGARPRRLTVTGPESLTTSERRVAEMAAAGRSNPEIAQALFVSRKTVETHLGRVYLKLSINKRSELGAALRGSGDQPR